MYISVPHEARCRCRELHFRIGHHDWLINPQTHLVSCVSCMLCPFCVLCLLSCLTLSSPAGTLLGYIAIETDAERWRLISRVKHNIQIDQWKMEIPAVGDGWRQKLEMELEIDSKTHEGTRNKTKDE